ncbi:MAG TPA: branched-chain amino acid ABC transporter substrate-binding protein [Burkholderiales bacterium]|nr:branched-chain amino acid ABC transporter substrate-binding protein [Burkholderiales bacterium]
MRKWFRLTWLSIAALSCSAGAADTVKIAVIDPLSGPFANVGEAMVRHVQLAIDMVNARGGVLGGTKFELVTLDSKSSPQEAQLALKQAIDQGVHYINQTNGSNVAGALVDAVNKHNERNPDKAVLYMNTGAVDPALTNDKCSFWHFRFDADADMKMAALSDAIAQNKQVKKLYLINQDYAFGQAVAKAGHEMISKKRPDVQIVGDELHPLGKIKDFAPYVAKIKAAQADTVLTGNWGNDMTLLVKSARDAGYTPEFYTYYAGGLGSPPALGDAGLGHLKQVTQFHSNIGTEMADKLVNAYKQRFKDSKDDLYFTTHLIAIEMLAKAMEQAKSTDPLKVAKALEGMKIQHAAGEVSMRADNHQLVQPLFISTYSKVDGKAVKFDVERTGNGFKTDRRIEAKDTALPTTCKMNRP